MQPVRPSEPANKKQRLEVPATVGDLVDMDGEAEAAVLAEEAERDAKRGAKREAKIIKKCISEFTTYGATGPLHDPTKGKLSSNDQQPRQGKRTDLDDMRDLARSGMTWKEMADQCPTVGKKHIMEHRARYLMTQSRDSCEVIVRFGPTGTSKTYQAINSDWSGVPYYSKMCSKENKWFCDYDGERKVILDEFRGEKHKMELSTVNQWLQDHNICRVEPKFGGCALIADKFVLTSSMYPTKWFPENLDDPDDNIDQLLRHITVIYEHTKAHPPLGSVFTTVQFKNETVHIIETRRGPIETTVAWCARVRAMSEIHRM
jgi:hypothetical protein